MNWVLSLVFFLWGLGLFIYAQTDGAAMCLIFSSVLVCRGRLDDVESDLKEIKRKQSGL